MRFTFCFVAVAVAALGSVGVRADTWGAPLQRIVMSTDGRTGLKILPDRAGHEPPSAEVFWLRNDGKLQKRWKRALVNEPVDVYVAALDHGGLVTLDSWGSKGYDHSVVVYSKTGGVLADYRLEDLLTRDEIRAHAPQSTSSRTWRTGAVAGYEGQPDGRTFLFVIRLPWGKVITVDMATGKLTLTEALSVPAQNTIPAG